ncbi:MAG: CDP-alcohol phosphatidyltransferase family protein [Rhabdochlamydiaceae bacterium]
MLNIPNFLTFLRAPLALLFLCNATYVKITSIVLAMLTDMLDGLIARKTNQVTSFGTILDPIMDKMYVFFTITILFHQNRLSSYEICAFVSRDFFLILFGIYLTLNGHWQEYRWKAVKWSKVSTFMQFIMLIVLTLNIRVHSAFYIVFVIFGLLAFIELLQFNKEISSSKNR